MQTIFAIILTPGQFISLLMQNRQKQA